MPLVSTECPKSVEPIEIVFFLPFFIYRLRMALTVDKMVPDFFGHPVLLSFTICSLKM
jgi:hypothetical protein